MKFLSIFFSFLNCFLQCAFTQTPTSKFDIDRDSTLHERFIFQLLKSNDIENRWIFTRILTGLDYVESYEIIELKVLYEAYASKRTGYNSKLFLNEAYDALTKVKVYGRYINESIKIIGPSVNMRKFKNFQKIPFIHFLKQVFDNKQVIRKKYKKWLNEIIAICYENNVCVVTPKASPPYYLRF